MAKKGKFKCSACGRRFGMAAHLGRHMSTVHASKTKRMFPAVKTKGLTRPAMILGLEGANGIAAAVSDLQRQCDELATQRAALDSQMAALDQALAILGAAAPARRVLPGTGRRGAGYRPGSLKAYIHQVFTTHAGALAVKDVTAAVLKAGYKSTDKTFAKSVGVALRAMRNVTKVGRGVFRAK